MNGVVPALSAAGDPDLLSERDVINALLPYSRKGEKVTGRELIAILRSKLAKKGKVNAERLKLILKKVAMTTGGEGSILKPENMR